MRFLKQRLGFPKGTFVISFTFTLYNLALGTMYSMLILYLEHGLKMPRSDAYLLWGTFFVLFFCSSLVGGYLGGLLDHYTSILVGLALVVTGCFTLAISKLIALYFGLGLLIAGSGLFVPNALFYLGQLFAPGSHYRDSAFTICFVLSNIGVFIAASAGGLLANIFGYSVVFILAGTCSAIALLIYLNLRTKIWFLRFDFKTKNTVTILAASLFVSLLCFLILKTSFYSDLILLFITPLLLITIVILAFQFPKKARTKLLTCLAILLFSMVFWVMSSMSPSVITMFLEHNVDRHVLGINIPTATFYSLASLFTIIFAPLIGYLWLRINRWKKNRSVTSKVLIGVVFISLAYLILVPAINYATAGYVAGTWLVFSYLLQTLGEIFTAPITQSMIGEMVPKKHEAFMLGARDFIIGISGVIGGFLAARMAPSHLIEYGPVATNKIFSHDFLLFGSIGLAIAIIVFLATKLFDKLRTLSKKSAAQG